MTGGLHGELPNSMGSGTFIDRGPKINDPDALPIVMIDGRQVRMLGGTMLGNAFGTLRDVVDALDLSSGQHLQLPPGVTKRMFDAEQHLAV